LVISERAAKKQEGEGEGGEGEEGKENAPPSNHLKSPQKNAPDNQLMLKFLSNAVNFILQIHSAVPVVCELLGSKNNSDAVVSLICLLFKQTKILCRKQ
jgi:hypothetical protein